MGVKKAAQQLGIKYYTIAEWRRNRSNAKTNTMTEEECLASESTVRCAMQELGLLYKCRRPNGITKSTTEIQEKENLIKRDFKASEPLSKLLTDITEVPCSDGKPYVSPMLDCYAGFQHIR